MPYAVEQESDITEIVPGLLYRVGSVVGADHLSWRSADATGYEPLNAYLFTLAERAIFLDTAPAIAQPGIRRALAELVGDRAVSVFPSRNESDCVGNMGYVLGRGRDPQLLFGGGGGILEWINHPDAGPTEINNFLDVVPVVPAKNGTSSDIDNLHFDWMNAPVKEMFLTQWAYERTTKTLFTSDFFGWQHLSRIDAPVLQSASDPSPTARAIADEIVHRINWLPGAYCPDVLADFARVMSSYDIEVIAPVHGAVLMGKDLVQRTAALATEALELLTSRVPA